MEFSNSQASLDDVLEALSNVQRRKLLDSLSTNSSPDDAANPGVTVDVEKEMHHNHLPRLVDCGLINWDKETNRVTKGPNFEAAEGILEYLASNDRILPSSEVEA